MKTLQKTLLVLLPLFLLLFVLNSCESCENQDPQTDDDVGQTDNDDGPVFDTPPENIVTVEEAKDIYDAYTERRVSLISQFEAPNDDGSPFNATRYGEYDFETIKDYIGYIEQEAEDVDVNITGLRFYFANYPETSDSEFKRHNTFFLLPTMNVNGVQEGFVTVTNDNGDKEAVLIRDIVGSIDRPDGVKQNTGMNHNDALKSKGIQPKMLMLPNLNTVSSNASAIQINSLILNEAHLVPPPNQSTEFDN